MARFEVFIPAADPTGFNVTLRVDATSWMAALKTGMQKLGEQGSTTQNVLVDIQDDESVHVTDPSSGRVFRIREFTDADSEQAQPKKGVLQEPAPVAAPPASPPEPRREEGTEEWEPEPAAAPAPTAPTASGDPAGAQTIVEARTAPAPVTAPADAKTLVEPREQPPAPPVEAKTLIESRQAPTPPPTPAPAPAPATPEKKGGKKSKSERRAAAAEEPAPSPAPVAAPEPATKKTDTGSSARRGMQPDAVVELEAPTRPVTGKIGRERNKDQKERIEDLLAEVFERVQEVYAQKDRRAALYFLLDLALEKIPAESGTVFQADAATGDLTFEAVRGPRAKELLDAKLTIPSGSGVAGFCAMEGVSIALSDIQKDPRYYSVVAQKVNYTPKSVLCTPMMADDRTFGCLQILNRREGPQFTEVEMGVAHYIAKQAAAYLNNL